MIPKFRLILERSIFTEHQTLGKLYLERNKIYLCDTLEDKFRDLTKEAKVFGETCIPCGIYPVKNIFWPHFNVITPRLYDVPGFDGIRLHTGNTDADTEGCPLVGTVEGTVIKAGTSTPAFNKLWSIVQYFDDYEIEIKHITPNP